MKKTKTVKKARHEVICVRCGFTKVWTQAQWDRHMKLVHDFANELRIGTDPAKQPRMF